MPAAGAGEGPRRLGPAPPTLWRRSRTPSSTGFLPQRHAVSAPQLVEVPVGDSAGVVGVLAAWADRRAGMRRAPSGPRTGTRTPAAQPSVCSTSRPPRCSPATRSVGLVRYGMALRVKDGDTRVPAVHRFGGGRPRWRGLRSVDRGPVGSGRSQGSRRAVRPLLRRRHGRTRGTPAGDRTGSTRSGRPGAPPTTHPPAPSPGPPGAWDRPAGVGGCHRAARGPPRRAPR